MASFIVAAMDDDPGGARCAHFAEGVFLLPWHRCSVFQVLWPLYHRSVRMYGLRSEANRRSGSAAKVRAASIRTGLFGGRPATTTQPMTPNASRAAAIIQGSRTMASSFGRKKLSGPGQLGRRAEAAIQLRREQTGARFKRARLSSSSDEARAARP